jgi:transcriptional regulator with XRE-family HTH domain
MASSTYDPRNAAIYRAVGALVAARRGERGLTQEQLAGRTGRRLSRAAVANIESGRQRVAVHHLFDLAHALGVAPATLIPDEGEMPPPPAQAADQLRDRVVGRTGRRFLESKQKEEET